MLESGHHIFIPACLVPTQSGISIMCRFSVLVLFIYLVASGISSSTQDLRCVLGIFHCGAGLSSCGAQLWPSGSLIVACRLQRAQTPSCGSQA